MFSLSRLQTGHDVSPSCLCPAGERGSNDIGGREKRRSGRAAGATRAAVTTWEQRTGAELNIRRLALASRRLEASASSSQVAGPASRGRYTCLGAAGCWSGVVGWWGQARDKKINKKCVRARGARPSGGERPGGKTLAQGDAPETEAELRVQGPVASAGEQESFQSRYL